MTTTPHDKALTAFTEYFVRNYPGPDTVIFDPKWHAPKLFNAAMKAIEATGGIVCAREPAAWSHRLNLELDQFITEFTGEPEHPFGEPGEDYSPGYTVTSTPLHIPIEAGNGGDGYVPAPRGGVEPNWWEEWVKTTRAYNKLAKAAQAVIDETDHTHDSEPAPVRYRAPYGSITNLREVLALSDRSSLVGNGGDGWEPIETAPKNGTQIDLWGINLLHHAKKGERIVNVAWGPVIDWMGRERDDWQHGRGGDFQPTHWRPLPPPPSLSNEGAKP